MIFHMLLVFIFLFPTQAVFGQESNLNDKISRQIEQIKVLDGETGNFQPPALKSKDGDFPVQELIKYGMDSVPELIPLLADDSPTNSYLSFHRFRNDYRGRLRINEFVIFVINEITEHNFCLPGKPARGRRLTPTFQKR